ncbi:hypothetical protein [Maioricimonas rarisocia]|uniref:hypothetical protein n=1 Tax=Maioricimonas rarisocia TaxID=2528026 RepID=UPI0018D2575D|nr:hypothetical protein [Maioricimonas rarisocia]
MATRIPVHRMSGVGQRTISHPGAFADAGALTESRALADAGPIPQPRQLRGTIGNPRAVAQTGKRRWTFANARPVACAGTNLREVRRTVPEAGARSRKSRRSISDPRTFTNAWSFADPGALANARTCSGERGRTITNARSRTWP